MAAARSRSKQMQEPMAPQVAWVIVSVSVVVAVVFTWLGLPAGLALLAGVLGAAAIHPSPELTGKHPVSKQVQPETPEQHRLLDEHRFFGALMGQVLNPVNLFWPRPSTVVAWSFALVGFTQPAAFTWVPAVSGVAVALVVSGWCAAKRSSGIGGERIPALTFASFADVWAESRLAVAGSVVGGGVAGAAAMWVASWVVLTPLLAGLRSDLAEAVGGMSEGMMYPTQYLGAALVAGAVAGAAAALSVPWLRVGLKHWHELQAHRQVWEARFEQTKAPCLPRLMDFRVVGEAVVFTFDTQGRAASDQMMGHLPKLRPQLDSTELHIASSVPVLDKQGAPQPGSVSPTGFEITSWPGGQLPSLAVVLDDEVLRHALHCGMTQIATELALPVPLLNDMSSLRPNPEPGSPAMWATSWHNTSGVGLRQSLMGGVGAVLGCDAVADHRTFGGAGTLFLGDLGAVVDDGPRLDLFGGLAKDGQDAVAACGGDPAKLVAAGQKALDDLLLEDQWERIWKDSLKQTVNPPTIRHFHHKVGDEAKLANGTVVEQQAFSTRLGLDPKDMMNSKVETSIGNGAVHRPFVLVTGWLLDAERDSSLHASLMVVHSSTKNVPEIHKLVPVEKSRAPQSVLAGYLAKAFDHARLPRAEIARVECLTSAGSREGHIWRMRLWLYGGVTLADVRKNARKLQSSMGVPWLRVAQEGRHCVIVAGVDPSGRGVRLAQPDFRRQLLGYDWSNLWSDAGVVSESGELPQLLSADEMPHNALVTKMVFTIPPGRSLASMRGVRDKLQSASKNSFVDIRPEKGHADRAQVMVAVDSPMRWPEPFVYDSEFNLDHVPFGVGVDGTPLVLRPSEVVHLALMGTSGSGKSAAAQTLITGTLLAGAQVFVADVQKGAADFKFAEPWLSGIATTDADVLAMMELLNAEKNRRVALNSAHGVGHVKDLPAELRPPQIWFFIDEFFGIITTGARPSMKEEADPEMEAARLAQIDSFNDRRRIAYLSDRFAAEARSADIHLCLMTQKLTAKMMDGLGIDGIKVNLNRVLLGKATYGDKQAALRSPDEAPEMGEEIPRGRGIFEPVDAGPEIVQFWYASTDAHAEVLGARLSAVSKVDVEPYRPKVKGNSEFAEIGGSGGFVDAEEVFGVDGGDVEVEVVEVAPGDFDFSFMDDVPVDVAEAEVVSSGVEEDAEEKDVAPGAVGWGLPPMDQFFVDLGLGLRGCDGAEDAAVVVPSWFEVVPPRQGNVDVVAGSGWDGLGSGQPVGAQPVPAEELDPFSLFGAGMANADVPGDVQAGGGEHPDGDPDPDLGDDSDDDPDDEFDGDAPVPSAHPRAATRRPARATPPKGKQTPAKPADTTDDFDDFGGIADKPTPARRTGKGTKVWARSMGKPDDFDTDNMPDPLEKVRQANAMPAKSARTIRQ